MGDIREEKKAPRRVALVPWVMHSHYAKCTGTLCYKRLHTRIHGHKKRVVTVCSSAIKRQRIEEVALHHSARAVCVNLQQRRHSELVGAGFSAHVARALLTCETPAVVLKMRKTIHIQIMILPV